jgi:lysozyme family protein
MKFDSLKDEYARLFASARIRDDHAETLNWHVNALRNFRPRYEALGTPLGIPWFFIGAIHGLEASFNFRAHLHNGDYPLTTRTRQGRAQIVGLHWTERLER